MYILLIQPPPALQPSPSPVPPLVFKAAGRDVGSSRSIALLRSWGADPASHSLPNSLPLIARAGAEKLVLIIVGNTNQKGTFCCSWLHLCFLSASFQQIFSVSVRRSSWVVAVPSLAPGQGPCSRGWGWAWWGRGCLGGSVAGIELLQPRVPSGGTAHDAHDGSSRLPDAGAASCLPPCPKPLPLGTSTPGRVFPLLRACPPWDCPLPSRRCHRGDWLYRMYFVPLQ